MMFFLVGLWCTIMATTSQGLRVFEAPELSTTADISVRVLSLVPAVISWNSTDDGIFTIVVHGEPPDQRLSENIKFKFETNETHASLQVTESDKHQVAPVAGKGSRAILNAGQIFILLWVSAFGGNWRHIFILSAIVIGGFMAHLFGQTYAQAEYDRRRLIINILAPRHLHFLNVSLVSQGGKIRYRDSAENKTVSCRTGEEVQISEGCTQCCYGRGMCVNNTCQCDGEYDMISSCQLKERLSVVYVHPLDPRLVYSKLSTGDEVYLYFIPDAEKGTIKTKMAVKKVKTKKTFLVDFDRNGNIKRLNQNGRQNRTSLMMLVSRGCQVRVYNKLSRGRKNLLRSTSICQSRTTQTVKKIVPKPSATFESNLEKLRNLYYGTKLSEENSSLLLDKYINVSVKVKSCGVERPDSVVTMDLETVGDHRTSPERIDMHAFKSVNGDLVFHLPNITANFSEEYNEKCLVASSIGKHICLSAVIRRLQNICSELDNLDVVEYFYNSCLNFFTSIELFCDLFKTHSMSTQSNCVSNYDESRNVFRGDELVLKPIVTFDTKKVINTFEQRISLESISLLGKQNIIIKDDKPKFRITGVTISPPDPLPLDLYQVRVDFACATNYTLIDMRVRGSDLYTNYATCSGTSHCNCCILHAAGAPGSVVDNIIINVTDSWTGTNLEKTVVVVF